MKSGGLKQQPLNKYVMDRCRRSWRITGSACNAAVAPLHGEAAAAAPRSAWGAHHHTIRQHNGSKYPMYMHCKIAKSV